MSGMAEVLAAHRIDHRHDTVLHEQCVCGRRWMVGKLHFETHLEDVLTAAGFGPVKEAGAKALEEAAAVVSSEESEQWDRASENLPGAQIVARRMLVVGKILRARAAAVRGEG